MHPIAAIPDRKTKPARGHAAGRWPDRRPAAPAARSSV